LRTIYDVIDPRNYEKRHECSPREAYSHHYWKPLICKIIQKYSIGVEIALDIGCGTGVYTEEISRNSQMCVGLDLSKNMIEYAKKKRKGLNLILADAHKIPFRDECFGLVVSVGLLEYVQKDIVLKEIARVMKRKAFLIIVVLNKYSACRLPIKILSKVSRKKYIKKEPSLKEMLRSSYQVGFKLIWYKIDDGLIFLPDFLDRVIGKKVYPVVERMFNMSFGRNPFSNVMLFLLQK
jgi:ubiquinone/menaquinone biosynthesis C-methylase UbiE